MEGISRREYIGLLGATGAEWLTGSKSSERTGCDSTYKEDILERIEEKEKDLSGYSENELDSWRKLEAYNQILEDVLEDDSGSTVGNCDDYGERHLFIGEQHRMGDGMKLILSELEENSYDTLGLEFLAPEDPVLKAFNENESYDGREIGPEEMVEHYLTPTISYANRSREMPLRWDRDRDVLEEIFVRARDDNVEVEGLEPYMYDPLYPKEKWGEDTASDETEGFRLNRFEEMVKNAEKLVEENESVLTFSGAGHVQPEMYIPSALIISARPRLRNNLELETIFDRPYMVKAVNGGTEPEYARKDEIYTLKGRMPDVPSVFATSAGELYNNYDNLKSSMDGSTNSTDLLMELDMEIRENLMEMRDRQPLRSDTPFDFELSANKYVDFDDKKEDEEQNSSKFLAEPSSLGWAARTD